MPENIKNPDIPIRYAQVYRFLADAFLYPEDNWLEDLEYLNRALENLKIPPLNAGSSDWDLQTLQAEYRRVFGLTGSLCYETEYGLPHEFRQSQELADLAGFYQAFGFKVGGRVRERPDHVAVQMEFMYLLALKEALAISQANFDQVEICQDAQGSFLTDHLGQWLYFFAEALIKSVEASLTSETAGMKTRTGEKSPYAALAHLVIHMVESQANHLGVQLERKSLAGVAPTPIGPEISCDECPISITELQR